MELVHEVVGLGAGATVGVICMSDRGAANIAETLQLAGMQRVDIIRATPGDAAELARVEAVADLVLMSREAIEDGFRIELSRPERIRTWTYDFDPSGIELLRRAIEHVQSTRTSEGGAAG
jgi:hypothetical protein